MLEMSISIAFNAIVEQLSSTVPVLRPNIVYPALTDRTELIVPQVCKASRRLKPIS